MKIFNIKSLTIIDILLTPFVIISSKVLRKVRRIGVHNLPFCKRALLNVGVFPILNHYYEPQFDYRKLKLSLSQDRVLLGINWNITEQLKNLDKLIFSEELNNLIEKKENKLEFDINNTSFCSGDYEFWYQMIRAFKPKKIFEIGCGQSTLMAMKAINKNQEQNSKYKCKQVCIEPYEAPWLESTNVTVVRNKVEDIDLSFFSELQENDILFIDSSHIIRPQGDVLFEYLELLPSLNKGVIVHLHDIFSPKNYLSRWIEDEVKFWNEQYLLEAFLSHNHDWKILASLNYLHHHYYTNLKLVTPFLTPDREPGSFYIQKIA
jgi:Methyltransferase domain